MLKIENLRVAYGGIQALSGISLEVPDGKTVTLIGANGAGKSTTLRTISSLVKAQSGSITYGGMELLGLPREGYSQGQKKKVALAASLAKPAHLFLWDEPLNYIDLLSRRQLEELLTQHQPAPAMVMVEHDAWFLRRVAERTCPVGEG